MPIPATPAERNHRSSPATPAERNHRSSPATPAERNHRLGAHASVRAAGAALAIMLALTVGACQRHGVISGGGTLSSTAGTVDVQCVDRSQVKIVGFAPAAGYAGEIIVGQQASNEASLKFTNPNANDYTVIVRCVDSQASLHEVEIEDTTLSG